MGKYITALSESKTLIVKIGSALLVDAETGQLRQAWLSGIATDIADIRARGTDVIIVSSGAIALGRTRLNLRGRQLSLSEKQACAAVGQAVLTRAYEDALAQHGFATAQALLTLPDTEDRTRWINASRTLRALLKLGAVPVINENDTVATDEIRYGDNDRLAARTAQMVGADMLVLLSDIDGLYTADPRRHARAQHMPVIAQITPGILAMGGDPNSKAAMGSGGMATKLLAAQIAVKAGCHMIITSGEVERPLSALQSGARASWFVAHADPASARKQWISGQLRSHGQLHIDDGAAHALRSGKSLLPAGVTKSAGSFSAGDAVTVVHNAKAIAKGLAGYDAAETQQILGLKSGDITGALGYSLGAALIHRDNLVLL
ncbi:glutamate 5-kinase [Robiginitomaculum antarcticum]|uniref:glutamate 5-kinase n=1 Tax=Robiginitomaculum antarcticum TaxID=437507 RepID=UPI0003749507|nr:glutamate 5-kinase [Robiginitomaculum antarcticum]